jgi:hypothetical protein
MATRSPHNLISDLNELKVGEYIELETFGGGDYEPGKLLIERVADAGIPREPDPDDEILQDEDDDDDEGYDTGARFTVTSFIYSEPEECDCDDDDDDCDCDDSYDDDPDEEVTDPMSADEAAESVGDFAY